MSAGLGENATHCVANPAAMLEHEKLAAPGHGV